MTHTEIDKITSGIDALIAEAHAVKPSMAVHTDLRIQMTNTGATMCALTYLDRSCSAVDDDGFRSTPTFNQPIAVGTLRDIGRWIEERKKSKEIHGG